MTLSIDKVQQIKKLVKDKYPNHIGADESLRLLPDITKSYEWEVEANIERLCFNCGPGKSIKKENTKYEIELKNNSFVVEGRADVILKNSSGFIEQQVNEKENVFNIIENKLAFSYQETISQIEEAVTQLNKYIKLFELNEEYKLYNEFFISVCIFNPLLFLERHNTYFNYLNDKYSTQEEKYSKYGILILTLKMRKDGSLIFLNKIKNTKITIIPNIIELKGNLNIKEHFLDKDNFTMTVNFLELHKLPLTNMNPSSKINNPREYIANSPENKTRRTKIFKTMESLYPEDVNTRSRSLGAKNREIGYDSNETIMCNIPYFYQDNQKQFAFKDVLIIATTNMSLIDGQHSTQAFVDLYKNKNGELSWSKYGENNFKQNMTEYFFGLNFKGYNKVDLALNAAINQNNIAKQTRVDEILLELRDYIIKLANYYNGKTEYILNFSKSSYNLEDIDNNKIIWAYYFTYIWGVLEENQYNKETFQNTANSKTTPSQSNGNNLRKSVAWVFEDERSQELIEIEKLITRYIKKINSQKFESSENIDINEIEDEILYNNEDEMLEGLSKYLFDLAEDKIDSFTKVIKQTIYTLKSNIEDNKVSEANENIDKLHRLLTDELKIKENLLNNIILVLGKIKNEYIDINDKIYKIKVVMTMWLLRYKFKYDKKRFTENKLEEKDLLECLNIIKNENLDNITNFENYMKNNKII